MSGNGSRTRGSRKLLQRAVLGSGAVGTIFGVATVVVVYWIMTDFHAALMQRADAVHDTMLLDAIARESNTMMLVRDDRVRGGPQHHRGVRHAHKPRLEQAD